MKLRSALVVIAAATMTFGVAFAQDDRGPRRDRSQDRDRNERQDRGGTGERRGNQRGGRGAARMLRYDANGDMLVDEAELRAALEQLQANAGKVVERALKGIDHDGDGKLNDQEAAAAREAMQKERGGRGGRGGGRDGRGGDRPPRDREGR